MKVFLSFSLTGNIIGSISLVIGIISLYITVKTMKTASRIEGEVKEAQIVALDKKRFKENKSEYIKKLTSKRKAVLQKEVLSLSLCNDVLSIINDIKGYSTIISKEDLELIEQQRKKIQGISLDVQNKLNMYGCIQEFDYPVSTIISILSKGEYDL